MTRVEQRDISPQHRDLIETTVMAAQVAYGGDLLAFVFQDERGIFINFRPGNELPIARKLAEVDWDNVVRMAEEHTE